MDSCWNVELGSTAVGLLRTCGHSTTWQESASSANRMLVKLIENGIEGEKRKHQEFFRLAERFRTASDPAEAKRLGDELGRMVFGD